MNTKQCCHKGKWKNIPKEKSRGNAKTTKEQNPKITREERSTLLKESHRHTYRDGIQYMNGSQSWSMITVCFLT